ncbi:pyridoxal phosphate-dependent decarboxylase family protein [Zafaria sp. J156]|uniref:pyridoxal phosphate-dependent decarboxylase family protein n=1 Tax=Zafaria sp. J156 TaxID=3116490 RepID=UPI002E7872A1|nr:aspartate aminotransferase family protein [Zafaria sp. J156]MEE1621293.1 aspartate aminotransferase family protein [Zafaria sp. J156]
MSTHTRTPDSPLAPTPGAPLAPTSGSLADALLCAETAHRFVAESGAATLAAAARRAVAGGRTTGPRPETLTARIDAVDLSAPLGSTAAALAESADLYLRDAVYFHHPRYAAHLNCPVAIPAVAAEAVVTSLNSSMDTWDQSAGATLIERRLVDWAAGLAGLGADADGIFTSGGTQSNVQALLMARNRAVAGLSGRLPERLADLRIYASADSHFSIRRAASMLGLGDDAVTAVPVDAQHRMDAEALGAALARGEQEGTRALAVVATAGTTDFGAVDPLRESAALARAYGAWFHVDAAYGCGLLASERHRGMLTGIEAADSVTLDFHKSFFQPIGSSALLVRDRADFAHITHYAEYLNPAAEAGAAPNQVDKSLQTTRRFDAFKLWVTLRSLGTQAIGTLFDVLLETASAAGERVRSEELLELAAPVQLSTVVFRYAPPGLGEEATDRLNDAVRASLYASGEAMVAATTVDGRRHLKLTLLNPRTTADDVDAILDAVLAHGALLARGADPAAAPAAPATDGGRA